jgi:membrane-bound serine protease (ClpP class)
VDRELDVATLALVQRGLRQARSDGSSALVVEIDTPGGSMELMSQLAGLLGAQDPAELSTVAWVSGQATSAGSLVALACERVFVSPTGTMGSAMPVGVGPGGIAALPEQGGVREKVTSLARAEFRAVAAERGRSPRLAEAMVDPLIEVRLVRRDGETHFLSGEEWDDAFERGDELELVRTVSGRGRLLNVTGPEAVELGLADGTAASLPELLARLGLADASLARLERSASEETLALLEKATPLLIAIGLMLGYAELKAPGFALPGILALVCFALVLVGKYLTGLADVPHLVLVCVGFALIALELFVLPGTVWVGLAGAACVAVGLLLVELGPGSGFGTPLTRDLALAAARRLALAGVLGAAGILALSRVLPRTPLLRRLVVTPTAAAAAELAPPVLAGSLGRALTVLHPVGKIALDADPAHPREARAEGELIDGGVRVRVVAADELGGRLVVEAADSDDAQPRNPEEAG